MSAFNASWIPDEDPQTLFSERCWLQGLVVTAVAYGITLPLYFLSFYRLIRDKDRVGHRNRLLLLIFTTATFLLGTLYTTALAGFIQMVFIDDRNYPGGPNAFENNMFYVPINYTCLVAYFVSSWLCDAVMVWRFKVFYDTCGVPIWILMFFPCLLLAGSIAMGTMFLIHTSATTAYTKILANFGMPFLSLSLALNIILTLAIVLRLLTFRRRIVSVLGPRYGTRYMSAAAMIVESAALYSTVSIAYLTLFGLGNSVSKVFLQSLNQFQTIAMLLIVFRVARGKGWIHNTTARVLSGSDPLEFEDIQFASSEASVTMGRFADSDTVIMCGGVSRIPSADLEKHISCTAS